MSKRRSGKSSPNRSLEKRSSKPRFPRQGNSAGSKNSKTSRKEGQPRLTKKKKIGRTGGGYAPPVNKPKLPKREEVKPKVVPKTKKVKTKLGKLMIPLKLQRSRAESIKFSPRSPRVSRDNASVSPAEGFENAWLKEFNDSKDLEFMDENHPCIKSYTADAVFSITIADSPKDLAVRGREMIAEQWHLIRSESGCLLKDARGRKINRVSDQCVIQSYDQIDLYKGDKKTISLKILAEVWKLIDGEWKITADYVMVLPEDSE